MDDEASTMVRNYPVREQADDLVRRLRTSGILATIVGPAVVDEGWGVTVPATDSLLAGLIARSPAGR